MEQLPTEHQSTVRNLREDNDFADVTLVDEDCQLVEAQKVNLVASSPPGIEKNMNLFCNLCKEICVSKTGLSNHLNIVHKLSKEQIKSSLHKGALKDAPRGALRDALKDQSLQRNLCFKN